MQSKYWERIIIYGGFLAAILFSIGCLQKLLESSSETGVSTYMLPENISQTTARFALNNDVGSEISPKVIERKPLPGQKMPLDAAIEIRFDQIMVDNKVLSAFIFTSEDGISVDGEISWPTPQTLRFQPAEILKPGTEYHAIFTVESIIKSGISIINPFKMKFITMDNLKVSYIDSARLILQLETSQDSHVLSPKKQLG